MRAGLALCAFALAAAVQAGELRGRVVGVADGDTLTVLDAGHQQIKVRLAEIDAPISGGNSGGVVFNGRGEAVGLVSHSAGPFTQVVPIGRALE